MLPAAQDRYAILMTAYDTGLRAERASPALQQEARALMERTVRLCLVEQDLDSRHACAQAISFVAYNRGFPATVLSDAYAAAQQACLNASAI